MMVWKCPPLHLPNWSNNWKWKQEMSTYVSEYERGLNAGIAESSSIISKLQSENDKYKQVLESIANERVELSHDKIKWQCEDHIKWAKDVLK
jgi:hypothetical protein